MGPQARPIARVDRRLQSGYCGLGQYHQARMRTLDQLRITLQRLLIAPAGEFQFEGHITLHQRHVQSGADRRGPCVLMRPDTNEAQPADQQGGAG